MSAPPSTPSEGPRPRRLAALCLALAALLPAVARADAASAEALYQEGLRLLDQGRVDEACAKLAESLRAEPALGTLINLASCRERQGKLAAAWSLFQEARAQASRAGHAARLAYATEHARALEARIARLVLSSAAPLGALSIAIDDERFGEAILGTPLPIDPGDHQLALLQQGQVRWRTRLSARAGETLRVELPELPPAAPAPSASPPAPSPAPPPSAPAASAPAATPSVIAVVLPPTAPAASPSRAPAYVVGGLGLLALGAGAFLGLRAIDLDQRSNEAAARGDRGASDRDYDAAVRHQTYALVAGAVGLVGLGAGVYLFVSSSPSAVSTAPRLTLTARGIGLSGGF